MDDFLPTITPDQRNALYERVLVDISGMGQLSSVLEREDYEAAYRLARVYSDDLLLVLTDLGWGKPAIGPKHLKSPPDVLLRTLTRFHTEALDEQRAEAEPLSGVRKQLEENEAVRKTCDELLAELGAD